MKYLGTQALNDLIKFIYRGKKSKRPVHTSHTKGTVHVCKNKVDFGVNFFDSKFADVIPPFS